MTHTEYYSILGVEPQATPERLKKAYRKMSLKWHPDRNQDKKEEATKRFQEISEAYQILSNPEKRKIYDLYGKGAAQGQATTDANCESGMSGVPSNFQYQFSTTGMSGMMDADSLFNRFFGGSQTVKHFGMTSSILDDLDNLSFFCKPRRPKKRVLCQKDLPLTLEELATGCQKRLHLTSENMYGNQINKKCTVDVSPGWKEGTKITFPYPECGQDVQFIVREIPHAYLKREGDNLSWKCNLTKKQAQKGIKITLKTPFPNEKLVISTRDLDIYEGQEHIIVGKGMSIKGNIKKRGDLIIRFYVR
jgi:DnaJ-class molecular chaperone